MTVAALVGNPHAASRTRTVAEDLVRQLAARYGLETGDTIDLADHGAALFTFPEPTIDALTDRVAATEILVVASPTYKASYTGLLKAFLDRYPTRGLAGVTAIPLFTVGSPAHTLAVDVTLRPLLVELGASVPTSGIAFPVGEFPDRAEILASWIEQESAVLDRLLTR
ncbi:MAG: NAD(P)H-dependent oxidoreductase [Microbacterium sp.]|uniref:NADPH-dependent FMN reductase n=1 Tax=Microbacterium sp. TaxID=51671 RepID=UPI001AD211C6|nr:NAD(P)H-dependent oxidoreductase [Microbacterium sp.]MBN9154904.1 NAD(P)H-dependent oxidoreductase [Microbacterium sp.]MBN9170638.1 NAD(P)H-dependent oxidoreductase [Microbacterium sp.]MBN9179437.1 NAD(P)H-dependent oxidoreductase [Microbacterium sp.]